MLRCALAAWPAAFAACDNAACLPVPHGGEVGVLVQHLDEHVDLAFAEARGLEVLECMVVRCVEIVTGEGFKQVGGGADPDLTKRFAGFGPLSVVALPCSACFSSTAFGAVEVQV